MSFISNESLFVETILSIRVKDLREFPKLQPATRGPVEQWLWRIHRCELQSRPFDFVCDSPRFVVRTKTAIGIAARRTPRASQRSISKPHKNAIYEGFWALIRGWPHWRHSIQSIVLVWCFLVRASFSWREEDCSWSCCSSMSFCTQAKQIQCEQFRQATGNRWLALDWSFVRSVSKRPSQTVQRGSSNLARRCATAHWFGCCGLSFAALMTCDTKRMNVAK